MPDVLAPQLMFWLEFYALGKCRFLEGCLFKTSQLLMPWWKLSLRPFSEWLSVSESFWEVVGE